MLLTIVRRVAVFVLVGISLLFSAYNLFISAKSQDPDAAAKNEVSIWENRFESLKRELPTNVGHVGYISESDLPDGQYSTIDQFNEFQLTRYVLSPVIVVRGVDFPWIIGNFSSRKFKAWLQNEIGDYRLQEFSGGIYLIHKVQQ
jgi:hypothetical protein